MRVQHISIQKWRHFEGVELSIPPSTGIVCLAGGNGTGKSQILELIAACAGKIGLSTGTVNYRGQDPFIEQAEFEVKFFISPGACKALEREIESVSAPESPYYQLKYWDRTIAVRRSAQSGTTLHLGLSLPEGQPQKPNIADHVKNSIVHNAEVHYLFLDADRAYPKIDVGTNEIGSAFERDWDSTRKQSSFQMTKTLYEEWFRYILGKENQHNNELAAQFRIAEDKGIKKPEYVDHLADFKNSLKSVLPHLLFVGVDARRREIKFDSTGTSLGFHQLSGGEREIAFQVGQIDRFSLRRGLLLIDEPELHLNYDLLRNWIGYLKTTVLDGQIWLASHSLEVVEVTGQDATFILNRNQDTRQVDSVTPLSSRPALAALSRAVGSPAFSMRNLAFVFIEGDEAIGERERFRQLCAVPKHVRFMEGGSCNEVIRRLKHLREISTESQEELRAGAVVDRDWRPEAEIVSLTSQGIHVLQVHEVENFFLHPPTQQEGLNRLGQKGRSAQELLREALQPQAGSWIFNKARTDRSLRGLPEIPGTLRGLIHNSKWTDFSAGSESTIDGFLSAYGGLTDEQSRLLRARLLKSREQFEDLFESGDLWKYCEGKEAISAIATLLGLKTASTFESLIFSVWADNPDLIPTELTDLRRYLEQL